MPTYDNLPGVEVQVNDRGLAISPPPAGPTVMLLGVTDNSSVTVGEVYTVEKTTDKYQFYLSDGTPSKLAQKITEAWDGGATSIEVMVVAAVDDDAVEVGGSLEPTGLFAALATAYDLLLNHPTDYVVPVGCYIDHNGLDNATQNFGYQLADFCYNSTINDDTTRGGIDVSPPNNAAAPTGIPTLAELSAWATAVAAYDTTAINGDDFSIWDGTTDADADGVPDNYAFWATSDGAIPTGSPPSTDTEVVTDEKGNPVDIGAYIDVVGIYGSFSNEHGAELNPTLGYYYSGGAAAYAGMISSLPYYLGSTNQLIPGLTVTRQLSKSQANSLAGARVVCMVQRSSGYTVASGVTGAYNISTYYRSDFTRLPTVRIVHYAIDAARDAGEPFIGRPNNALNQAAMKTAIESGLRQLVVDGAVTAPPAVSLEVSNTDQILGIVNVRITLRIAGEIITVSVNLALEA